MNSFHTLGLKAEILRAVSENGYTAPTPIQAQVIPVILAGRDVLASAQTGTGKTAGFTLPILQRLSQHPVAGPRAPRALILTPTRELAAQVSDMVRTYGKHLSLKAAVVFGGVGIVPQIKSLRDGRDIVIATPGRLLDHVQQRTIDLSRVEVLVLDEADRMLDMGFIRDIQRILALLPRARQNLLFSATFSSEIRQLARQLLRDPATVEAPRRSLAAEGVTHVVHPVQAGQKRALLSHLIQANGLQQVLIFTRTKHGADRLARQLKSDGIVSDALHGNKSQSQRTRALADFKRGRVTALVATDIAARGLDIDQLPQVVNFDLPHVPEDYVHRIGRTGRAGATGNAISLVCTEDAAQLRAIERVLRQSLPVVNVAGFEGAPRSPGRPAPTAKQHPGKRSFGSERPVRRGRSARPGRSEGSKRLDRYDASRSERRQADRPHPHPTDAGQRPSAQGAARRRVNSEVPALLGDGMAFKGRRFR